MIKNFAKFTATMGKGIKVGDSDVEIKLTLPLKVVQENFMFLSTNQGEKINVFLGDPQIAFDFEDEDDDAYKLYQGGRRVTADASGVVTAVEQPEKDDNQTELTFNEPGTVSDRSEDQASVPVEEPPAGDSKAEDGDELNDYEKEIMGEGVAKEKSDLPECMQEGEPSTANAEEPHEMDFEGSDQGAYVAEKEGTVPSEQAEVTKDELEQFILRERPSFDDIPLDFPMFLEKRLNEGKTWVEISKIAGVPSSQLQPKWKKYKEKVAQMMSQTAAV